MGLDGHLCGNDLRRHGGQVRVNGPCAVRSVMQEFRLPVQQESRLLRAALPLHEGSVLSTTAAAAVFSTKLAIKAVHSDVGHCHLGGRCRKRRTAFLLVARRRKRHLLRRPRTVAGDAADGHCGAMLREQPAGC